jgi:hypothetical protein
MEFSASVYLNQKLGTLHTVNIGTLLVDCTTKETNILYGQFCQISCSFKNSCSRRVHRKATTWETLSLWIPLSGD